MKINKEGHKIIATSGLICLVIWALIYYFLRHDYGTGLIITSTVTLTAFWFFIVAFFRELLGSGTLFGFRVIPEACYEMGYVNNGMMMMPAMALIIVACIIWVHRSINKDLQEK